MTATPVKSLFLTLSAWWHALAPIARQRAVLGVLVVAALATRDLLLFAFAAGLALVVELLGPRALKPSGVAAK